MNVFLINPIIRFDSSGYHAELWDFKYFTNCYSVLLAWHVELFKISKVFLNTPTIRYVFGDRTCWIVGISNLIHFNPSNLKPFWHIFTIFTIKMSLTLVLLLQKTEGPEHTSYVHNIYHNCHWLLLLTIIIDYYQLQLTAILFIDWCM